MWFQYLRSEPGNYRSGSKVLEGMARDYIDYALKAGIMRETQHGFLKACSCQSNLLAFHEEASNNRLPLHLYIVSVWPA